MFTVFSPKGGVGKTTMAVNLSVALARTGALVCVVDLDLAFGDVAITMQLIPEHTISEAAESEHDLDFSLLQKLLTRHESGLTILAAPTHPEGRDLITANLARRVIQTLRRNFDFVVIDTPPGFDDQVLGALDETDECIIVATLDVPTIKNTKVALETLDLLHLVPNQSSPHLEPGGRGGRLLPRQRRGDPGDQTSRCRCRARMPSRARPTMVGPSSSRSPTTPSPRPSTRFARRLAGKEASRRRRVHPSSVASSGARRSARKIMSSLSDRLASLNRTIGHRRRSASESARTGARIADHHRVVRTQAPRRRADRRAVVHRRTREAARSAPGAASGAGSGQVRRSGRVGPDGTGSGTPTASATKGINSGGTPNSSSDSQAAARAEAAKDRFEDLKESVHSELLQQLGPQLYDANLEAADLESKVRVVLADVLAASNRPLTRGDRERITQDISDDILGYGPLEPYLRDVDVAEVMVNGPFDIYLERRGKLVKVDGKFKDEAHLRRTIDKIVSRIGRRVDESSPMVDARLPDGSRVNAVVPPLAIDGSILTIRKFAADPLTVNDLIKFGSLSDRTADFLDACVRGRLNVVVSGGTGAGKTTTLNVLSSFIPSDERIVTIEDAAELQLKQDHVVRLESRPANIEGKGAVTIRDLVRNALRMRPDRVVVGEVRDSSALDMLQAMNTGHDGSICTVHSNGPRDTCSRLETLVLMAGMDLPVRAIREQVASAVDLIVHQQRLKDGTRRITHVTEVERMEGDVITLQDIFLFDNSAGFDSEGRTLGTLKATGLRPKFLEKMLHNNVTVDPRIFATTDFR